MLRTLQDVAGFECQASDGPIGTIEDFYFDDRTWQVRVFVVACGPWLAARKVLIPSSNVDDASWPERRLTTSLTRKQVRASPDIDSMEPVSRQHEVQRYGYYGYPPEGRGSKDAFFEAQAEMHHERGDNLDLRSFRAMQRYHVRATDGAIGHLEGLIVDERTWAIEYLIIDTSDWSLGHSVLVETNRVTDVSWLDATVAVGIGRDAVKHAPHYRKGEPIDHPDGIAVT